jgi:hypothetical protein
MIKSMSTLILIKYCTQVRKGPCHQPMLTLPLGDWPHAQRPPIPINLGEAVSYSLLQVGVVPAQANR